MRRLTYLFTAAAIGLAGLVSGGAPASAAGPGTVTESTTTALPASPANMKVMRITRLSRTGEFLVVGRVNTAGTNYFVWQLKSDYTIDTSFGTAGMVDTGVTDPASCNTQYITNTSCSSLRSLAYNEVSGTYVLAISRTQTTSNYVHGLVDFVFGDLKTGAVKSKVTVRDNTSSGALADADFATLNVNASSLAKDECTMVNGTSANGTIFRTGTLGTGGMYIIPNGTLVMQFTCDYSNLYDSNGAPVNSTGLNAKEYSLVHISALKVVNGALALDTTWGSSGRVSINKADSGKCVSTVGISPTADLGITSVSSTKPYVIVPVTTFPRITSVPGNFTYATYDGCYTYGASNISYSNKLMSFTAAGVMAEALDMGTGSSVTYPTKWVIDPAGRWVSLVRPLPSGLVTPSSTTTYTAVRLVNGKADTTFGTNGQKSLSLASTITVNGTSVSMNYSISGMITTQDEVLFTGLVSTTSPSSFVCNSSGTVTQTYRPFVLSLAKGAIDTTYGTSGLGDLATVNFEQRDMCGSSWGSSTFVTSKGQPALLRSRPALGSQTTGVFAYTWETVANATGGGDGGTGTGGATKDTGGAAFTGEKTFAAAAAGGAASVSGRVDTKVYTKAPAKVQENSAVSVLKASEADDLDLVSTTPKVCIALTTSVVFTGTGRCVVRIIDEETRKVIRNFATTVTKAEVTPGTVLTTNDPIMFRFLGTSLTTKATAQVKVLAESAATVGRVLVVGHSASLYDNEVSNKRIALQRAAAVKAALIKAGVKAPISIVSVGSADPVSTTKTEAAQAKNRRVEVFLFPATES